MPESKSPDRSSIPHASPRSSRVWEDFQTAAEAIRDGTITLRSAQDFGVVTPLAAVVSGAMWLHVVVDATQPGRVAYAPINGGTGPAPRLGLCSTEALIHLRWLHGAFAELLGELQREPIDLIPIAAHGLRQGDDGHGRTPAATKALINRLEPAISRHTEARRFLDQGPSFFLNLWMAACKCSLSAAEGRARCSLVTAAGANGVATGIQVAGLPRRWFVAPANPPKGELGEHPAERALGAVGDSAIVDVAGFGAMAIAHVSAQQEALGRFMPADGLTRPERLLARIHPGFGDLRLRSGLCASRVVAASVTPLISLGILDVQGQVGRLGGGIFECPMAPFAAAVRTLEATA